VGEREKERGGGVGAPPRGAGKKDLTNKTEFWQNKKVVRIFAELLTNYT
jgi:hypothetical protein